LTVVDEETLDETPVESSDVSGSGQLSLDLPTDDAIPGGETRDEARQRADEDATDDATPEQPQLPGFEDGDAADRRDEVATRLDELRHEGHGPQRHLDTTDDQLRTRLGIPEVDDTGAPVLRPDGYVRSTDHIDPETGTTEDAVHGGPHRCGPVASRFDSGDDYVTAEAHMRHVADDTADLAPRRRISDVLGAEAEQRMTGCYHDPVRAGEYRRADFTDGTIQAVYYRDGNGDLRLTTMYANPGSGPDD
jgi:hypothetical protein